MSKMHETWETCTEYSYKRKLGYQIAKRIFDIIFSLLLIIILLPFFLIFILLSLICQRGKVFYGQVRYGRGGKTFKLLKFRTMRDSDKDIKDVLSKEEYQKFVEGGYKLENDPRVTPIGRFYRKFSIDELPQLFNILFGTMSFVGPRPIIYEELQEYGDKKDLLLSVKPGLTGYWAVNGRSDIKTEDRQKLELFYVKHCSLWLDTKILFKTPFVALFGKGAR